MMIKKIREFLIMSVVALSAIVPIAVPVTISMASAAPSPNNIQTGLCTGSTTASGSGSSCAAEPNGSLQTIAKKVVNIFSALVGAIAIIMLIWGGFKYITSGGESGNITTAKNTIIYAIVGLIIVALAQLIVNVVLTTSGSVTGGSTTSPTQ